MSGLPLVIFGAKHAYSIEKHDDVDKLLKRNYKNKPIVLSRDVKIFFTDKLRESIVLDDCVLRGNYLRATVKTNINDVIQLALIHEPGNQNICSYRLTRNCIPEITIPIRSFKPGNLIAVAETSETIYFSYSYIRHGFACYAGG